MLNRYFDRILARRLSSQGSLPEIYILLRTNFYFSSLCAEDLDPRLPSIESQLTLPTELYSSQSRWRSLSEGESPLGYFG
jgi:hypothetical protein